MPQYCYKCVKRLPGPVNQVSGQSNVFHVTNDDEARERVREFRREISKEGFAIYEERLWDLSKHPPRRVGVPQKW